MENFRCNPYASCSTCVCASPNLLLQGPDAASEIRKEKVHQAVGLLCEAATFMRKSLPVKEIEGGILKALRARHMTLTTVAVPYDWLERCRSIINEARCINMHKEDCHPHSIPCKYANKLIEAEALLTNEQVQEVFTLLRKAASRVEVGWPFILDVSSHPMPWQADNTVPWTIAVPIDWLKRRNVFMKEFQAIKEEYRVATWTGDV